MKNFIIVFCAIACFINTQGFTASPQAKTFTVGTTSGYAPFVSLNHQGAYEGFDIDVAKELARKLGRPLTLKDCGNMPSLMLALKQKKVDALIWAISITETRKATFDLVHYQGEKIDTVPLVFWDRIPENLHTLSDLAKASQKPVCVEAGSYQEDILQTCPSLSLKYLAGLSDVILDLKCGQSLASAVDPSLVPRLQNKYPKLKVLFLSLPQHMHAEGNGICLNKSDPLTGEVSRAIAELKQEGVILQLEKKWGLRNDT